MRSGRLGDLRFLYGGILAGNGLTILLLFHLAHALPVLLSEGFLAYLLGLRHAFDADHIAAIDNTSRKLINDGQPSSSVGFFFALGHSTVVTLLALALALAAGVVSRHMPALARLGQLLGTAISSFFLFLVAGLNLWVLRDVHQLLRQERAGVYTRPGDLDKALSRRGLMNRILGRSLRLIRRSWQMYPVGFLFGLGFDTSTEVALLGMATLGALHHQPTLTILILPLCFAAGMTLMDTTDGVVMSFAYRWALSDERFKLYYNFVVTLLSVIMALLVGSIEVIQVAGIETRSQWPPLLLLEHLSLGQLGTMLVAILVATWALAVLLLRFQRRSGMACVTKQPLHEDRLG